MFLLSILAVLSNRCYADDEIIMFVGEKISLERFEPVMQDNAILMDEAFKAKYKVLRLVGGNYENTTIEFEVYDHYGWPQFSKYKYVLLFVAKSKGTYYHEKYKFVPVYPTTDGQWASCGKPPYSKTRKSNIVAHVFNYTDEAVISTAGLTAREIRKNYPKSYFNRNNGVITCKKGNSVEEIINNRMQGSSKGSE